MRSLLETYVSCADLDLINITPSMSAYTILRATRMREKPRKPNLPDLPLRFAIAMLIGITLFIWWTDRAHAEPMSEAEVAHAVAGEAKGCSFEEQKAIAHAILNRGHLKGVYGSRASVGPKALLRASGALKQAINEPDPTAGADHWLSAWDLAHCRPGLIAWRLRMTTTLKTPNFTFYRSK